LIGKLFSKSTLKYKLAKHLDVFDPRRMAADDMHDDNKLMVRNLLQHLVAAK
jgi:hypothetical protein